MFKTLKIRTLIVRQGRISLWLKNYKLKIENFAQSVVLTPYRLSPKGRDPHCGDNTPPPTVKSQAMVDPKAGCRMKI